MAEKVDVRIRKFTNLLFEYQERLRKTQQTCSEHSYSAEVASLTRTIHSIDFIIRRFQSIFKDSGGRFDIDIIESEVLQFYCITKADISKRKPKQIYVWPKKVLSYYLYYYGGMSMPKAGRYLNLNHSTILNHKNEVLKKTTEDPEINKEINTIYERINEKNYARRGEQIGGS